MIDLVAKITSLLNFYDILIRQKKNINYTHSLTFLRVPVPSFPYQRHLLTNDFEEFFCHSYFDFFLLFIIIFWSSIIWPIQSNRNTLMKEITKGRANTMKIIQKRKSGIFKRNNLQLSKMFTKYKLTTRQISKVIITK